MEKLFLDFFLCSRLSPSSLVAVWLLIAVLIPHSVNSAVAKPYTMSVSGKIFNDSNRGLNSVNNDPVTGVTTRLQLSRQQQNEHSRWQLRGALIDEHFFDETRQENDYKEIYGNYFRTFQRSQFNIQTSLKRDTTLADEFLLEGPATTQEIGRDRQYLSAQYSKITSTVTQIDLSASYQGVDFTRDLFGLQSYDYYSLSLIPRWKISSKSSWYFSVEQSRIAYGEQELVFLSGQTSTFSGESETQGLSIGWGYLLSQRLRMNVNIGYRETDYENVSTFTGNNSIVQNETGSGITGDLSFTYSIAQGQWAFKVNRSTSPNSSGTLIDQQNLEFGVDVKRSETLTNSLKLRWLKQRSELEDDTSEDFESAYLSSKIGWRIAPSWYLVADYRYIYRELKATTVQADSHRLQFGVRWKK